MRRAAALILLVAGSAAARPAHIASLDLCTDELLVELADRDRIASLSPLARDPGVSTVTAAAATLPGNRGSAERVLLEHADLVLTEPSAAVAAASLLQRLGLQVAVIEMPERIADIASTVRKVAGLVGEPARGEAAIARMQQALERVQRRPDGRSALFYDSNGLSAGPGTLEDEVLSAAGLRNYARALGLASGHPVPLERVALAPPDMLITQEYRAEASLAEAWPANPALRVVALHIRIPAALMICGTPAVADAVTMLADAAGGA